MAEGIYMAVKPNIFIKTPNIFRRVLKLMAALFSSNVVDINIAKKERLNSMAEEALDTYGNAILRLAYSYVHNLSDSEEILQDTVIKYIEKSPAFDSENHKKAWLLHVAANLSKNRIKYNSIRNTDELSEELKAENREDLSFVWEAVKNLPENYREVIHLFYYEGFSVSEISKITDKNESTVRSALTRGRAKLKDILKEAYDFE